MKLLWLTAGGVALALGVIGVFLPVLPTTPFILLAAFCWAKSSERLYQKLLSHPVFGAMIRDWQQRRVIPLKAKILSLTMMSASMLMLFYRWWHSPLIVVAVICSLVCLGVVVWMWRLPSR